MTWGPGFDQKGAGVGGGGGSEGGVTYLVSGYNIPGIIHRAAPVADSQAHTQKLSTLSSVVTLQSLIYTGSILSSKTGPYLVITTTCRGKSLTHCREAYSK